MTTAITIKNALCVFDTRLTRSAISLYNIVPIDIQTVA